MSNLMVVVLAAGKGTRMNSKQQKILHAVGGKPMVQHVFESATRLSGHAPVMVVGPGERGVQDLLGDAARYVVQAEQLGTGHATQMAQTLLAGQSDQVIVTYGDMPLTRDETLANLAKVQKDSGAAVVILTMRGEASSSFGRIYRQDNKIIEIVEVAEAKQRENSAELLAIRELNVGIYCFSAEFLWENIANLPLRQARSGQEYYLTDMVGIAVEQGLLVESVTTSDASEALGAGTRAELVAVERAFRDRAVTRCFAAGVTVVDPATTYIDPDVIIGKDSIIWPNTHIQGNSVIGEDCVLGPNSVIRSAEIGNGCIIEQSVVENIVIEDNTWVPPFTHAYPEESDVTNAQ